MIIRSHGEDSAAETWADFGVITPLLEEFNALKKVFGGLALVPDSGARNFYCTYVRVDGHKSKRYRVIVTNLHEMGQIDAANAARDLLEKFNPAHVIVLGVAGAMQKPVKLGDVLVSSSILYYELAKLVKGQVQFRPQMLSPDMLLLSRVERFFVDDDAVSDWAKDCLRVTRAAPKLHIGIFASGEKVVADDNTKRSLLMLHPKILGIEMEAAAVFWMTHARKDPSRTLMIRGISDDAGPKKAHTEKKGKARAAARTNAAHFFLHLLKHGGIESLNINLFTIDPKMSPKVDRRLGLRTGCSYPFMPKLVRPIGPIGALTIEVLALDRSQRPLTIEKALWIETRGQASESNLIECPGGQIRREIIRKNVDALGIHLRVIGEAAFLKVVTSEGDTMTVELKPD